MTHSRQKKFGSAVGATAAQQQMSLVSKGQVGDDQPASPDPRIQSVQAGKTAGEFQGRFGSSRAAEMKGPQSKGQRPESERSQAAEEVVPVVG